MYGHESYPQDATGEPVIRTGGSLDMSWYIPPAMVAKIAAAVSQVPIDAWEPIDTDLETVSAQDRRYLAESAAADLELAREAFGRSAECYQVAADRGFGVSVEFY
jgi:hypothetical protein